MVFVCVGILLFAADQLIKYFYVLADMPQKTILPGLFALSPAKNTGMSLGLFPGGRWVFIAVTIAVFAYVVFLLAKRHITKWQGLLGITCILAGGCGNLVDRVVNGYVVDLFYIPFFPFHFYSFNFADFSITVGTIFFLYYLLFSKELIR